MSTTMNTAAPPSPAAAAPKDTNTTATLPIHTTMAATTTATTTRDDEDDNNCTAADSHAMLVGVAVAASASLAATRTRTSTAIAPAEDDAAMATAVGAAAAVVDSGRESMNEGDSSLDEHTMATMASVATTNRTINTPPRGGKVITTTPSKLAGPHATTPIATTTMTATITSTGSNTSMVQLSKKPCTEEFYASSGSQTVWYLPPGGPLADTTTTSSLVITPTAATLTEQSPRGGGGSADKDGSSGGGGGDGVAVVPLEHTMLTRTCQDGTTTSIENNAGSTAGMGRCNGALNGPLHLSLQIRAVSSPAIADMPPESRAGVSAVPPPASPPHTAGNGNNNNSQLNTTRPVSVPHVGVLQKFKRTLTQFNKTPSTEPTTKTTGGGGGDIEMQNEGAAVEQLSGANSNELGSDSTSDSTSGIMRFGPLIWRTSKERRKAKHNRRDKCNSGDSGIQIELENDEQYARTIAATTAATTGASTSTAAAAATVATAKGATTTAAGVTINTRQADSVMSPTSSRSAEHSPKYRGELRRTNSAKNEAVPFIICHTTATTTQARSSLRRFEVPTEREAPESRPTRSLSQPNGLDVCGITATSSRADLDESDSDSVTSHDEVPNYLPTYAEVLYNFTAAGPQELGLDRGALVEILRKEVGLWWFGRLKKEEASLVEEILEPELGWFPKEFVRIIQCPETDLFYLKQMAALQQMPPAAPASTPAPVAKRQHNMHGADNDLEDNDEYDEGNMTLTTDTTIVDENNVTTIVIDSPASSSIVRLNESTQKIGIAVEANNCSATTSPTGGGPLSVSRSINVMLDTSDILRRSAVKELLDTEVNYVNLLTSICEGYLPAMEKRIDIFSPGSVRLIFSNILGIYRFQKKFLEALRKGIEQNQVAKVFLKMHKGFLCYSTYCNDYPRALIELESYERLKDAKTILDNCRESENLAELPLSAHLLAPVQRICRYPLHLGEMMKTAASQSEPLLAHEVHQKLEEEPELSHVDIGDTKETISLALEAMKGVTEAVNEGKRHSETIARHQASFQNFKGPPLHVHSTRFFLQIDATRQKQNLWNSSYTLFLFDNQLVYCKRDLIKRSQFIYKGRIMLDRCRVVNVRDGKMFGHTIKNSLRIYCESRDKWYDFSFRSANRKHRFLSTLALERQFGSKPLYVKEMTGYEYAFEERDYSDQSDYEMPDIEVIGGGPGGDAAGVGGLSRLRLREYSYDMTTMTMTTTTTTTPAGTTSGESSVPDSPAKSTSTSALASMANGATTLSAAAQAAQKYSDTLPKKTNTPAVGVASAAGRQQQQQAPPPPPPEASSDGNSQTSSLGRRRLGKWFRKPKSSNSTPNHSPTHKPNSMFLSTSDLQQNNAEMLIIGDASDEANLNVTLVDSGILTIGGSSSTSANAITTTDKKAKAAD